MACCFIVDDHDFLVVRCLVFFMACNFLTIVAEAFQHENGKLEACILSRQQLQYAASDVYISGTSDYSGL